MFNLSIETAQIPEDWRRTIVTPVAKSPCTTYPRQFRPISLTSVVCKILDTILKEKLLSQLSLLLLLTTSQHGFLPRRSTVASLSAEETVTQWHDEGDTVDIVYLNYGKAFDSVNHHLLLNKLKCNGIAPSGINWIVGCCFTWNNPSRPLPPAFFSPSTKLYSLIFRLINYW